MSTRKISWEIVLAGLTFIGIGIYLYSQSASSGDRTTATASQSENSVSQTPTASNLPGSIVIDLQNLESLKQLKNLENLKKFETELENIDNVIEQHMQSGKTAETIDQSLHKLESKLQGIEKSDFNIKVQDQKVYISRDYDVNQAEWSEVSPGVYIFQDSFTMEELETLDFTLGFGNVNIVGSDSRQGEITLRATGEVEDPARLSENIDIQKTLASPTAIFKVTSSDNIDISNKVNLEATLSLPKNIGISAKTSGGHIHANNLTSNQKFNTSGGHISLDNIKGKTVAKTAGGHITGSQIFGSSNLTTGGGHIKIKRSTGSLTVKTGGGHIEIEDASGNVNAKTSGGNISASILNADGPLKFNTSAGNISVSLPQDIAADLDASGSTVNLADIFDFSGTKNQGDIKGSVNGGGVSIVINCEYGNVNINSTQ